MKNTRNHIAIFLYKNGHLAILVIPILYILLLAYTSFYAHPNGEDLFKANKSIHAGIINAAVDQYIIYDGRYMTNLLHGFIPPVWSKPEYQFVSALFFLFFFISSAYYFFSSIFKLIQKTDKLLTFELSILFTACYSAIIPDLKYFMFLCPGGIVYGFSASIILLMIGSIFRLMVITNQKNNLFYLILIIILEIISIGMNEMNLVFTNITIFIFLIYSIFLLKKSHLRMDSIILFIFCFSFSIFSISSPGVGLDREMNFNKLFDFGIILKSIGISFNYSLFLLIQWIKLAPYLFLLPFLISILIHKKISLKILLLGPLVLLPISLLTICLTNVTYILPFHDTITLNNFPTRMQNTAQLFYLIINISGLLFIETIQIHPKYLNTNVIIPSKAFNIYIPLAISFLFFLHSTPMNLILDWSSGRIQSYDNKMNKRYTSIQEAKDKKQDSVFLETIYDLPYSITDNVKLSPNNEDQLWVNSYEQYYGIKIYMKK
ncbi:MAG: hypothetical protein WCP69_01805 [Bacteroidota bacterium]